MKVPAVAVGFVKSIADAVTFPFPLTLKLEELMKNPLGSGEPIMETLPVCENKEEIFITSL